MKVFSMFDGVGGFIVGLNNADSTFFQTLYSNQYEPSKKIKGQHIYLKSMIHIVY